MKRLLILVLTLTMTLALTSCGLFQRPAKCPAYDNVHTKTDKNGEFKRSKTKSQLFPNDIKKTKRKKKLVKKKNIDRREMSKRARDKRGKYKNGKYRRR